MTNEQARSAIEAVQERYKKLGYYGFHDPNDMAFPGLRAEMLAGDSIEQFIACCEFMQMVGINKTCQARPAANSYTQKVFAERWSGLYISNGMFIAAAVHVGARIARCPDNSPNAYIGLSIHGLRRTLDWEPRTRSPRILDARQAEVANGGDDDET